MEGVLIKFNSFLIKSLNYLGTDGNFFKLIKEDGSKVFNLTRETSLLRKNIKSIAFVFKNKIFCSPSSILMNTLLQDKA